MIRMLGRCTVSILLVAAGGLSILGARERWWPACPLGGFDSGACLTIQDSRYNYLAPVYPYTPLGNASEYAGAGLLVFAVAAAILPWAVVRGRALHLTVVSAVLALPLVAAGVRTVGFGVQGATMTEGSGWLWVFPAVGWALAWPCALLFLVVLARPETRTTVWGWVVLSGSLGLTTPIPQMFLSIGPYDSAPWSEATLGVFLIIAALALWPASICEGSPIRPVEASAAEPVPASQ